MHMRAQARASMQMVATLKPFPPPWEQTFFGQAKVQFGELERCFLSAFSPAFLARFLVRTRKHTGDRWHCSMHFLLFCVLSVRAAMPPASTAASALLQPLLYCSLYSTAASTLLQPLLYCSLYSTVALAAV
jgi:hypothetical protein